MELTHSWSHAVPGAPLTVLAGLADRFELRETRNAAAILAAIGPEEFGDLCAVLSAFELLEDDLIKSGGSESKLAGRLNEAFRLRGWREGRVDTIIRSALKIYPFKQANEHRVVERSSEVVNEGYKVDNVKGRVALDVEWNAKDGNLDRDIGAYRALYDVGLIDVAVIVTRTHEDLRTLAYDLAIAAGQSEKMAKGRLGTSTTTNLTKLLPRLTRGDAGGCPVLTVAICPATFDPAVTTSSLSDVSSSFQPASQGSLLDIADT